MPPSLRARLDAFRELPDWKEYDTKKAELEKALRDAKRINAKVEAALSGPTADSPFGGKEAALGLLSGRLVMEAANRGFTTILWSDGLNRNILAHLNLKAATDNYDRMINRHITSGLKILGIAVTPERTRVRGYGHWKITLTPEQLAIIRKLGWPLMAVAMLVGMPSTASAQGDEAEDESPESPEAGDNWELLTSAAVVGLVTGAIPALTRFALTGKGRATSSALLGAIGAVAHADEDERNIHRMGVPVMALALAHVIGTKRMMRAGAVGLKPILDAMKKTERGQAIIGYLEPDALLSPEVLDAIRDYERTVSKGRARATSASQRARELGPEADRRVSDVIEKEDWEQAEFDEPTEAHILAVAQEIINEFDELTQEKIATGVLTQSQALADYLPRRYAEWEALDVMASNPSRPGGSPSAGAPRISKQHARTLDIPVREAKRKRDAAYDAVNAAQATNDGKLIAAAVQRARDADDALALAEMNRNDARLALGEIREASYRAATGLEKGWGDVAAAKLFHTLRATPNVIDPEYLVALDEFLAAKTMLSQATTQADKQAAEDLMDSAHIKKLEITRRYKTRQGDYVALPDTKGMGVLRGMVVDKFVASSLIGVPEKRNMDKLMRFWKKAKTVFNPGTHVANFVSNISMAHMAGLTMVEQPRYLSRAAAELRAGNSDAVKKLRDDGILGLNIVNAGSEGMTGRQFKTEESLQNLLATTTPETAKVLRERGVADPSRSHLSTFKKIGDRVTKGYQLGDDVFRLAIYLKAIDDGHSPARASGIARESLGDFRTRSPMLRALRGSVAPFILYPAKALPAFAGHVVEHPWRYMTLVAMWGALNEYSEGEVGVVPEGDIEERDRNKLGYFFPGFVQLPWVDEETGNKAGIDVARWTPLSGLTNMAPPGSLGGTLSDRYPAILQAGGPFVDAAVRVGTNIDPFTGKMRIMSDLPPSRKIGSFLEDVTATMAPSALGIHRQRIVEDIKNEDWDRLKNDLSGFMGVRPRYIQKGGVEIGARTKFENSIQAAKQEYRRAASRVRGDNPARDKELEDRYLDIVGRAVENYYRRVGAPPPPELLDMTTPEEAVPVP